MYSSLVKLKWRQVQYGKGVAIFSSVLNSKNAQFKVVFDAIRQLMTPPEPKKKKIGFEVRERMARYGASGCKAKK